MCNSHSIEDWIEENVGSGKVVSRNMVSSSSWSSAYVYTTEGGKKLFVKQSSNGDDWMFKGEALGLQAMYGEAQMQGRLMEAFTHVSIKEHVPPSDVLVGVCRYEDTSDPKGVPLWEALFCSWRCVPLLTPCVCSMPWSKTNARQQELLIACHSL